VVCLVLEVVYFILHSLLLQIWFLGPRPPLIRNPGSALDYGLILKQKFSNNLCRCHGCWYKC